MLVNLSPKKNFRTEAERHAKYMNRHCWEYSDKKYRAWKFTEMFTQQNIQEFMNVGIRI